MIEILLFYVLAIWFAYYLTNHAEMSLLVKLRAAVFPVLPGWLAYSIQCAFCFSWWVLTALSLFTGWTPLMVLCPPVCLFVELTYQRLKGVK